MKQNERIDAYLSEKYKISRNAVQKLILNGKVKLRGEQIPKNYKLKSTDKFTDIEIEIDEEKQPEILPQDIPIEIIYEDEFLAVINKPRGMVTHPSTTGNFSNTLVNALLFKFGDNLSNYNGNERPGIVHRLDKDTSGGLIIAKDNETHKKLSQLFKEHKVLREYTAVVHGIIKEDCGRLEFPIGRNPKDRKKMAVTEKNSKPAITDFTVVERYDDYTLVKLNLYTGRTHQIRVHMSKIGHPIVGDKVYGPKKSKSKILYLHASKLGITHPITKKELVVETKTDELFNKFLSKLENSNKIQR
ncbi:MAG: RluA family pseudouridine synthase [Clostridia bacterium]|nr:RluA family pseudouridine synthase [Clostridia bacterium]